MVPYAERLPRLLAHRFGLRDVLVACECEGGLDSTSASRPRTISSGRSCARNWKPFRFNEQTSGKFAPQFADHGYRTVVLPSSSPAHMAMTFEQKLEVWRRLLELSRSVS